MSYNGWANYETWNINFWVMNDEACYKAWEIMKQHYETFTPKRARATARNIFGKKTPDNVRINSRSIDWQEIVNTWNEA